MLMTACVEVSNPTKDLYVNCRILLDDDSQNTYVTRRLQKALKLKIVGQTTKSVGGFGGTSTGEKQFDIVNIAISRGW